MATKISRCWYQKHNPMMYQRMLRSEVVFPSNERYHCQSIRTFSTGCNHEKDSDNGQLEKPSFLEMRRKSLLGGGRRRLSPFERIKDMMKDHHLSSDDEVDNISKPSTIEDIIEREMVRDGDREMRHVPPESNSEIPPGPQPINTCRPDVPLTMGEYVIICKKSARRQDFKMLVKLHEASTFNCKWGTIHHKDILGESSGQLFKTHLGTSLLIKRPSLEDFVLLMKRGPTILYPKVSL